MAAKANRRDFLKAAGAASLAALLPVRARADEPKRPSPPNFIIIYCDDLGYGDLACFGHPKNKTPNLDRMALDGLRCSDFHTTASVCSPSRAALLTGRYQSRVGINGVLFPNHQNGLSAETPTLSSVLKKRGYATACVGKWHVGHKPEFLPLAHGFDGYFGIPYSNDMGLSADLPFAKDAQRGGGGKPGGPPLMRGNEVIEHPADQSQLTKRYTEESLKFIAANKDRPFFLYLPHTMPHTPLAVSADFKGKSANGLYGDVIEELDWSVGRILDALRQDKLAEHTLVVFASDNGAPVGKGGKKDDTRGGPSNEPLRAGKHTAYEGGHRVPAIFQWPGRVPAGAVCKELASTMDLLPTFASLAGAPALADLDGHDIRPLLFQEPNAKTPYKFLRSAGSVRAGPWKLVKGELYNLDDDLGEKNNLAEKFPEKVKELEALSPPK
jgi:arylsulfatase A-like enzyme